MPDKAIQAELDRILKIPAATFSSTSTAQAVTVVSADATPAAEGGGDGATAPTSAGQNLLADAVAQSAAQLAQVQSAIQAQLDSLASNTQALADNTSAKSAGSATSSAAGAVANTVLGGGLLGSIVSGLVGLFSGDDSSTTATTKFSLPSAIQLQAGTDGFTAGAIDYGQNDVPRTVSSSSTNSQQITVNVSALDSQSFLDHSTDIANAVRKAMLESSSLNDVISEM